MENKKNNLYTLSEFWDCEKCSPHRNCFSGKLTPDQQQKIKEIIKCRGPFNTGKKIFRSGEPFSSLFIIKSGAIKLQSVSTNGENHIRGFYFPGDLIGIDAIQGGLYCNDAITLGTTKVCEIPYHELTELSSTIPALQQALFTKLSHEINLYRDRLLFQDQQEQFEKRLLKFLDCLSQYIGRKQSDGSVRIHLPMSRGDIACHLEVCSETVSRRLHKLQSKGVLKINGDEIDLIKIHSLKEPLNKNTSTS